MSDRIAVLYYVVAGAEVAEKDFVPARNIAKQGYTFNNLTFVEVFQGNGHVV